MLQFLVNFFIVQTHGRIHQKVIICRLQSFQNFAARIATGTRKYDHITPVLKELQERYITAFKCLTFHVPEYLSSQFIKRGEISGRATRSSQMLNPSFALQTARPSCGSNDLVKWGSCLESVSSSRRKNSFHNQYFRLNTSTLQQSAFFLKCPDSIADRDHIQPKILMRLCHSANFEKTQAGALIIEKHRDSLKALQ